MSLTITSVNDAPVAEAQVVTTPADTATAITLTATDVDGDTLTCAMVLRNPYYGRATSDCGRINPTLPSSSK